MEINVANDPLRSETAYSKACAYLNFNRRAVWLAHAAAVGTTLLALALLVVLWLFADLMVWRGRVPAARELSPRQLQQMEKFWGEDLSLAQRGELLKRAKYPSGEAEQLAKVPYAELSDEAMELIWQDFVWDTLMNRVGESAVDHVFISSQTRSGWHIDRGDRGVLSLVVREYATGRKWTPLSWIASWNPWMWNSKAGEQQLLPSYLLGMGLLVIILGLSWAILIVLNREMAARATVEATSRLRRAVYHHTFRLGTLAIRALGPSEAVSLLTRHIEAIQDALFARLTTYFREPILMGVLLAFAFFVDPLLSLSFLLFSLVVWQVGLRLVTATRRQSRIATTIAAERLTIIRESLMLMRLVKCYLMDQFNQSRIERQLARYNEAQRMRYRGESLAGPALILLGGICVLVLLIVGAMLVLNGRLSAAGAVILIAIFLSQYGPVTNWLDGLRFLKRGRDSADQVFAFLERKGDVGQVVGANFLAPLAEEIEFDNVSLRDGSSGRFLLENVSFSIPAGQRIGLVGADNLEKHALVYLIPRLLDPASGEIRIDKNNLRWVTLDSLRHQVGIVMMHNLVFHDSIKNNIGCGDANYTLPQIIEAAKMAHAHQFIQQLPQGYETAIGELGQSLSMNQQYRIALARAILRDPAVLIIEEPEVEMDDDTKALLDDTLARILPGRTVIFLPHRISTMRSCNRLYLLHKGRMVATGSHKELLAGNKIYRHLHYLEFNEMDEVMG